MPSLTASKETRSDANAQPAAARPVVLRRDVPALILIAVTLLTLVAVVTHDPADPVSTPAWPLGLFYNPDASVYPLNDTIHNACGGLGALLSAMLLDSIGVGTFLAIAAGGGVATAMLGRGRLNAPVLRSLGGCVVILAVCTAAAMVPVNLPPMPVVGNGGYLGAMTSTFLLENFHPVGSWILTLACLAVGLLLTTDYVLVGVGRKVVIGSASASRRGIATAARAMPLPTRRRRQPFASVGSPLESDPILVDGDVAGGAAPVDSDNAGGRAPGNRATGHRGPDKGAPDTSGPEGRIDPAEPTIKFHQPRQTAPKAAASAGRTRAGASASKANGGPPPSTGAASSPHRGAGEEHFAEDPTEAELPEPPPTRDLELEDETVRVRLDGAEEEGDAVPAPHIRLPEPRPVQSEIEASLQENAGEELADYHLPSIQLLESSDGFDYDQQREEARQKSVLLRKTIQSFGFNVVVTNVEIGPVIAQYEIELEAGLRLNKISALAEDLAIALRVPSVRVVAPIPGKNTVGIEVPNEIRQVVRLRDVIEESDDLTDRMSIPVYLGKDVSGKPMPVDLAKMPHLLIAGRTGTGKSVCLNAIITSILMKCRPDEVRMLMIDPKMVELSGYGRLPHLMHPVITDMKKAEAILGWAVEKMEERYSLLAKVGVRHINSFNDLGREEVLRRLEVDEDDGPTDVPDKLPFIVIVADEMADLMMTAGKDVEQHIIRLAQKSRAVGIHLILATQKPTVDVITGLIKSNLPARLSFQVASKTDSRVVLDENGADKLLGNGDMLFLWPGTSTLIRGQGTYLSDAEIDRVCEQCSAGTEQSFNEELVNLKHREDDEGGPGDLSVENLRKKDELYESAIEVVIREGRGSLSLIQRCLGIGYGRAARLVDYMAEDGIVGQYNGSKSREVLLTMAQWQQMQGLDVDDDQVDEQQVSDARSSKGPSNAGNAPRLPDGDSGGKPSRPESSPESSFWKDEDEQYEDVD